MNIFFSWSKTDRPESSSHIHIAFLGISVWTKVTSLGTIHDITSEDDCINIPTNHMRMCNTKEGILIRLICQLNQNVLQLWH